MGTKRVELIHKEQNEECFEILKSTIVEDKELKKFRIDKDTLLHELPEWIVNEFLDFLSGFNREHRQLTLEMIKNGTLTLNCWEDEEDRDDSYRVTLGRIKRERKEKSEQKFKNFDDNYLGIDTPF